MRDRTRYDRALELVELNLVAGAIGRRIRVQVVAGGTKVYGDDTGEPPLKLDKGRDGRYEAAISI